MGESLAKRQPTRQARTDPLNIKEIGVHRQGKERGMKWNQARYSRRRRHRGPSDIYTPVDDSRNELEIIERISNPISNQCSMSPLFNNKRGETKS